MYTIFEQAWFNGILVSLGLGLAGLVTWGFATLQAFLNSKIKDGKVKEVSSTVLKLIQDSVLYINQTFVDDLKKQGKFDKETQAVAFEKALERIKANLTEEAKAILTELYGDVSTWLETQVESFISQLKF